MKSNEPIPQHISQFLEYCKHEGLKDNTRENYERFLKKFTGWLVSENLESLLPHQLTTDIILQYKIYLSSHKDPKNGQILKTITQKYYLIALRALLGYFAAKDVVSLPPSKIALPKADKSVKSTFLPSLEVIDSLLVIPNQKTPIISCDNCILRKIAILMATNMVHFEKNQSKI